MGTCHQLQTIVLIEGFGDVGAKSVSSSTRGNTPPDTIVWVRPEEVTHGTFMGDLLDAVLEGAEFRGEE